MIKLKNHVTVQNSSPGRQAVSISRGGNAVLLEFIIQNWALILISVAFVILLKSTDLQDKSFAKRMYFLIAVVFLLSIAVFTEFHLADIGGYIMPRTVLMAVRYSAAPVIVAMTLFALQKKMRWFVFIPLLILIAINIISIFNGIIFSLDNDGTLHRGPLGYLPYIVAGLYGAALIIILYRNSNKQYTDIVPIIFLGFAFASGLILPFVFKQRFSEYFCVTILIALLIFVVISVKIRQYRERHEHDNKMIRESIETFTGFIDAKDPYTNGHSNRVARYSRLIAEKLGCEGEELDRIYYIALLHDCGKIGIPDSILSKPEKLTDEEYQVIKSHTVQGGEILNHFKSLEGVNEGALYHHERYDGKGYPKGLAGKEIPLIARIICVADSFDTMNSNRVYRKKLTKECIINEIETNKGRQFDPEIADVMLKLLHSSNSLFDL